LHDGDVAPEERVDVADVDDGERAALPPCPPRQKFGGIWFSEFLGSWAGDVIGFFLWFCTGLLSSSIGRTEFSTRNKQNLEVAN
ncbi:MAG: hypothetical protein ACO31K_05970, partial [Schleiferiaceae bacterium]